MSEHDRCPMCQAGEMARSEGRLDQSGYTYLPTTCWSCAICGFARFEPALGAHWRSMENAAEEPQPLPLRLPVRRAA